VQNKRPQTCLDENRALSYQNVARKENLQIVQVLAAIVLLFGICTSPHQVAWMLSQFGKEKKREIAAKFFFFCDVAEHPCLRESLYLYDHVKTVSKRLLEDFC